MTIRELINSGVKKLSKTSNSPELDVEVLLSHVLDKPKEYLLINPDKPIGSNLEKRFRILLNRRASGQPVAYLTKQKEFFGLNFLVNPDVLIPGPDTESLVEAVLYYMKGKKDLKILDLGTGSGNIIVSLAKYTEEGLKASATKIRFFASDISGQALKIAKKNANRHKVKINFKQGSLLDPWPKLKFDVIVANLPYGWSAWKNNSSRETIGLKFEPRIALFTKERGLYLYKKLFEQIQKKYADEARPLIIIEFDPRQTQELKKLAHKLLPAYRIKIYKDLSSRNRYAVLEKKPRQD